MNVLFLCGGIQEPSTRFRAQQFIPFLEQRGIRCTLRTAYGLWYNRLSDTPLGPVYKVACRLKRAMQTLDSGRFDVVFLQRTAFPNTALPERLAALRNPRLIYDFDDAVFLETSGLPSASRRRAFKTAVTISTHVIAGNQYLADYAAAPGKTTIIPTVVDTGHYAPAARARDPDRVVVGWMGTSGNFMYFPAMIPALKRVLSERPDVTFRMVSNAHYPGLAGHPNVEQIRWTRENELEMLQSFDVGVMPLLDTPWSRGKCGFKMIQYMSVGCPVVASAVGANVEICSGSGGGILAETEEEWYTALCRMIDDPGLRRGMGHAAREHVVGNYSVASVVDRYVELFERVGSGDARGSVPEGRSVQPPGADPRGSEVDGPSARVCI